MSASGKTSTSSRTDRTVTWLAIAAFSVVIMILTLALWILTTGIMDPPAPRSFHEKQVELLEEVVKQKPKVPEAWADWARALIVAKQFSAAERVLDRGEKVVGKKTPELALERARVAYARGDEKKALELLDRTLKVTEEHRAKELADLAERALVIDERTISSEVMGPAAEMKGDLLAAQSKWPEAEKAYSIAVYESPQNVDRLVKRGAVFIEMGESQKAEADFKKALTFVPDFEPALTGLERLEKGTSK